MALEERPTLDINIDKIAFFKEDVPTIINAVKGDEKPEWGIMTVQHMLEHLIFPLKFATGDSDYPLITPVEKLERQKAFLYSPYAMPKNFKVAFLDKDKLPDLMCSDLDAAKQLLLQELRLFLEVVEDPSFTSKQHPVFGDLDAEGWLLFQYKHFYHHFAQFQLIAN